jgi:hypothetical protein
MAHVHDHKDSSYFMEQLCTIGVCGALGGVAIILWSLNRLKFLGEQFQKPLGEPWLSPVLWGGVAVVALVLIRAVVVWNSVGKTAAHNHDHGHSHDHDHNHDHEHEHEHCDHNHDHQAACDHGHDHGWAPWRYVVLLLPVGLYFLNLIPDGFRAHGAINTDYVESGPTAEEKGGDVIRGFLELERAAATEQSRKEYEGRTAQVIGQATNIDTRRFGLVRYKIACCAADAVPLKMVIFVPATTPEGKVFDGKSQLPGKWVDVTGVIQFRKLRDSDEYVTVLEAQAQNVKVQSKAPENPFVY